MKTLTVFTPTYNRKGTLYRLYKSLCAQTSKDFVWLIVDDGSQDDTGSLVSDWQGENLVDIEYVYQENAGKPMAHNKGVYLTKTPLFTCVDSDDYLVNKAVETIINTDLSEDGCIGALFYKGLEDGTEVTGMSESVEYSTLYDAYHQHGLRGDTMLVYKSDIIKKHEFPHFEGERFMPEAYLYDRLDGEGNLRICNKTLYICEYLEGGYTSNIRKINAQNPYGYRAYITQRIGCDRTFKDKAGDYIRYTAICFAIKGSKPVKDADSKTFAALCYLPGYLFYLKSYRKYLK